MRPRKARRNVDAAGDGGHLAHVAADAGPARYIVWQRPATSGNLWQRLATRWQRDGRTGLETHPTWQGLEMLEKAGNGVGHLSLLLADLFGQYRLAPMVSDYNCRKEACQ